MAGAAAAGGALPSGGHYAAGKGAIGGTAGSLVVKQSSTTGIIDWNSFSIGKNNSVTFANGSGATLNEVTGGALSTIAGSLHASGSIYLINQDGIIVSGSGRIVTGGSFVASTGSSDDAKRGAIVEAGTIRSAQGAVRLTGSNVSVSGSIAVMRGGRLWLTSSGTTSVSGTLSADNAHGAGGTIVVTGKAVNVAGTANISASGTSKGGTILIGGDVHGGAIRADNFISDPVATAQTTSVARGATISADAKAGVGGNIVIWSDGHTSYAGTLSAEGSNAGGFAEVSSHDLLAFEGAANLTARGGQTGTLLLDPDDVVISTSPSSAETCSAGVCTPSSNVSYLNNVMLEDLLHSTNVTVTTGGTGADEGDISVIAPVTWKTHTLTLDAANSVMIYATMSALHTANLTLTPFESQGYPALYFYGGNVTFQHDSESLVIDGQAYTLITTLHKLQETGDTRTMLAGDYALAGPLDGSGVTGWIPIGDNNGGHVITSGSAVGFTGTFEGLGNTISNLVVNQPTFVSVGVFGAASGTLRDVGVVGGSVTGTAAGSSAGALVGYSTGPVDASYATASVTDAQGANVGGLVGYSAAPLENSYATGAVSADGSGNVGGLVGTSIGPLQGSYASGTVTGGADSNAGGLVGYSTGGVDFSYATGAVSGGSNANVGGLVGSIQSNLIEDSYATGAVNGDASGTIGGLVGYNFDTTIQDSFAAGAVVESGCCDVSGGGLVGINNGGAIQNSYASGEVVGTYDHLGGLVGSNAGSISDSYAFGQVVVAVASGDTSGGDGGGLVGESGPGPSSITASYWDIQTSGIANPTKGDGTISSAGGVRGLTTAQLQGTLPQGFSTSDWATGPGLFPYLTWQFQTTPQSISGTLLGYAGHGTVPSLLINGVPISPVLSSYSNANGYYYLLLAPSTIESGSAVLAYTTGTAPAATLESASDSLADFDIWQNALIAPTSDTTYSSASATSLQTQDAALIAQATGPHASIQNLIAGLPNSGYFATGSGFTIDEPLTLTNGLYVRTLASHANITVADALTVPTGEALTLAASGNVLLDAAVGGNGNLEFEGTGTGEDLAVDAALTGAAIDLESAGTISNSGTGVITARTLTGAASGNVTLTGSIGTLGSFSTGNGNLSLSDSTALTVTGDVNVGTGNVTLTTTGAGNGLTIDAALAGGTVTLVSAGTIGETLDVGMIIANTLTGSSVGDVTLTEPNTCCQANAVGNLGAFTTNNGTFTLTNGPSLTVSGAVNAGTGDIVLTTKGTDYNGSLVIDAPLTGAVVNLTADTTASANTDLTGAITQSSSGIITTGELTGSSTGATVLNADNHVTDLGPFSAGIEDEVTGGFALTNVGPLVVTGTVTSIFTGIALTTTGANANLIFDGPVVTDEILNLVSGGTISGNSAGIIQAQVLTGSSIGPTTLTAANQINDLFTFTTNNQNFSLTTETGLNVTGMVNTGTGNLTLVVPVNGGLIIEDFNPTHQGALIGNTVNLSSDGYINEGYVTDSSSLGSVTATLLNVTANSGIDLNSTTNNITAIGTDTTNSGPNTINQN